MEKAHTPGAGLGRGEGDLTELPGVADTCAHLKERVAIRQGSGGAGGRWRGKGSVPGEGNNARK